MKVVFFHRNIKCGFSINKVTQTIIHDFTNKVEYYMPSSRATIGAVIKNTLYIARNRQRKAINHITGDIHYGIIGLLGVKSVLTIHDTVFVDYNRYSYIKKIIFELIWFRIPIMLATKVVCISESTKRSIERFTSRKDIIVIHNAVDDSIHYHDRIFSNKEIYSVLVIGTSPNKNLLRVIKALKNLPIALTIIGKISPQQIKCLEENEIVYNSLEGLSDDGINKCYANSDLVCFCSVFEGFGMPILEANKSGCPIICSDIPVLHEVGGDAAFYVDPYNVDEMHEAFKHLLNHYEEREGLVKRGLENIKRFSPEIIKKQWVSLYEDMI